MNDLIPDCKVTGNIFLDDENIYKDYDVNLLRKKSWYGISKA